MGVCFYESVTWNHVNLMSQCCLYLLLVEAHHQKMHLICRNPPNYSLAVIVCVCLHVNVLSVWYPCLILPFSPFYIFFDLFFRLWRTVCASWGTCHTAWLQRRLTANRAGLKSWTVCYVTLEARMQRVQAVGGRRRRKRRDMIRCALQIIASPNHNVQTLCRAFFVFPGSKSFFRRNV